MKIAECNSPVADNISEIIKERGLKQIYVAEKAGYEKQQFNDMLNGRKIIKICDVMAIANALEVKIDDLYA